MGSEAEEKFGSIKIADEVIIAYVYEAVNATDGVATLAGGISDSIPKSFLGKNPQFRGIRINQTDEGILIDVSVIVRYGVKIPEVAWDLQESVKHGVEGVTGETVKAVNIHVQGVSADDAVIGE